MLLLFLIIPMIIAAGVSLILIYLVGMSAVSAFLLGAGICIIVGWLFGQAANGHGVNDDLYFSIVGWVAAAYMAVASIVALAVNYYAG